MITHYKNNELGLLTIPEAAAGCWINVIDPTQQEILHLQTLGIPSDYLTYSLDIDERPHTERENSDLFILLRIPFFQGDQSDIPYSTIPLGIILTHSYLVTVCKQENDILRDFSNGRVRGLSIIKRNRFILQILLATANCYLNQLHQITHQVDVLEDRLQLSTRNKEVLELLKFQKSLTLFTTALKSNELMLRRLQQSRFFNAFPEDEDLLEDVLTETQQAIEMTNIESNILSSMMDAFASIISNNLNGVMKFLASITIIISIPTMIASFYGMNVGLPFGGHSLAFLFILTLAVIFTISTAFIFWKRDWL